MSKKLHALIVGCGRIAGGYNRAQDDSRVLTHALAYLRHPEYELAACVDPDSRSRSAFMKNWNVAKGFATLDDALEAGPYDVVSICSPTGTHLAALKRLLETSPRSIFAEKPLDGLPAEARALGEKFAERGVPVAVNFGRRFDGFIQSLRAEIRSGKFGALRTVTGWYSGGVLNNGSHLIDLAIFLTGAAPAVKYVGKVLASEEDKDPTVSALLDLSGVPFHIIPSQIAGAARFELELCFERAILMLEEGGQTLRVRRFVPSPLVPEVRVAGRGEWFLNDSAPSLLSALDELSRWVPGVRLSSDIESACDAIEVAVAIRDQALENGI